jgi:hypothetical protein
MAVLRGRARLDLDACEGVISANCDWLPFAM